MLVVFGLGLGIGCGMDTSASINIEMLTVDQAAELIQQQKEKVVLLEFYVSTCSHCREQMPILQSLATANKEKPFEIIGLSLDQDLSELEWYARTHTLPFPLRALKTTTLSELRQAMEPFDIEIGQDFPVPFIIVLGKDGKKIMQWISTTKEDVIQQSIDQGLSV